MSDKSAWERVRREPLLAFLVFGMALFAIDRVRPHEDPSRRIVIDATFVEGLRADAARRSGHTPDQAETTSLIDAWVREETLYREARALELDVGDTIVRRRLVQKMELLLGAESAEGEPSDEELGAYLAAHAAAFARPVRTDVALCFFAREQHDDAMASARAALASGVSTPCDPHLSGDSFHERSDAQLRSTLGDALAQAIASARLGEWSGPFESPRGVYLVNVEARVPGRAATLGEVRDDVRDVLIEDRRDAAVSRREIEIASHYEVIRP